MTRFFAEITGWGKCLPPAVLSNQDLSTFLDTSDEWIRSRTGIENRRISHVKWGQRVTPVATCDAELVESTLSGLELLQQAIEYCKNKPVSK